MQIKFFAFLVETFQFLFMKTSRNMTNAAITEV